jgi:23S rRNA G2445 N2-methylase RlmL
MFSAPTLRSGGLVAGRHVAHVVVDGRIDTAFTRTNFPRRVADARPDGILNVSTRQTHLARCATESDDGVHRRRWWTPWQVARVERVGFTASS